MPFAVGLFVAGFVLPWLVWSYLVPRWRLWAYARVDDIEALKEAAAEFSLIWPEGHIFERTEFRPTVLAARLRDLEDANRLALAERNVQ